MKYSIIIPYRNREEHLFKLLPRLHEVFSNTEYEIIVAEQGDDDKFQRNSLFNVGGIHAKGDLLIFHDVDHYPSEEIKPESYDTDEDTPFYPIQRIIFLDENDSPRSINDIPYGYRNFHVDVGDHAGGIFVLHKNLFHKINGLNPYYRGWGKEDDDTRVRLHLFGKKWGRNKDGLFYALYHKDSKPEDNDTDFINNHIMLSQMERNVTLGYNHMNPEIDEFGGEANLRWIRVKNFNYTQI